MKIPTTSILQFLKFLAYLAMIGFSIEAGSVIISAIVSYYNPQAVENLYNGLDFSQIREYNSLFYYMAIVFVCAIAILKAHVWLLAVKMLSKFNISNPFTPETGKLLHKTSSTLLLIWMTGLAGSIMTSVLLKNGGITIGYDFKADEFLFMAGLIYIIAQVFKRGIEIQSENELTV